MAINVTFNGATIYKPGGYSEELIDLGGGFPVGPTGLVAIFGEAAAGPPGSQVPDLSANVFSPDQLPAIQSLYGSGPIVDACNFLFAPGADGAIPGGAQQVYIYKTNASVQATAALSNSYGSLLANVYGSGGNQITYQDVTAPAMPATTSSTAPFNLTGAAQSGDTMVLRIQGAVSTLDNTFTMPVSTITRAEFQTALNTSGNWSNGLPANMTFTVTGTSDAAASLTIAQGLGTNAQRNGYGMNFQLVSGTLLAAINIAPGLYTSESEDMAVITIKNNATLITESGTVGGNIVLQLGRNGGVAPAVTITATQMFLINNSVHEYTITLADFPSLYTLVQYINNTTGGNWFAQLSSTLVGQLPPSVLDEVTNLGANGSSTILPAQIKDDAYETQQFFAQSASVSLVQTTGEGVVGLPDPQGPTYLTGGALGGTSSADIVNALTAFQAIRVNSVVPLFSRDASADIIDGLTDPSSTYTIDAIHQAVKTHLSLMATTKEKSERQGYLSLKDTYLNCKLESQNMADARIQLNIQDIRQVNSAGVIQWFLPWAGSCLVAGARGGSPVGLPMTFKYFNMSGIRQTAQPMTTPEAQIVQDFNPGTQYDDAIMNGITFWEKPQTGGFRLVVDNTTYGADANWVYNRANVLYAADVLAFDFRSQLENIFVGIKNTISAASVKSTCDSILTGYLAQGITVSTSDAPNGYKQLVVQIVGNTINISVVVKLVEGIDFVLATITLQRASSSA
jgi:hypothetical protein